MGKFGKILSGSVIVLAAVVIAGVAVLKSIDINQYKGAIVDQVKAATGRDLALSGDLELDISLQPALVLRDVSFANPPGMSRPQMATLRRLEVRVDLIPLLQDSIRVKHLLLDGLDVRLERNAAGIGNWLLGSQAPAAVSEGGRGAVPFVEEVRLRNVLLSYIDGPNGQQTAMQLDSADLTAGAANGPVAFAAKGAVQTLPFEMLGEISPIAVLADGGVASGTATISAAGVTASVAGSVAEPKAARGLQLTVTAKAAELSTAIGLLQPVVPAISGLQLPSKIGPLDASAKITGSLEVMTATDIRFFAGGADHLLVSLTGAVHDVRRLRQADLNISVEGKDLSIFSGLAGSDLPTNKPFRMGGRLSDGENVFGLDGMTFKAGGTAVSGWITATLQQPRPRLEAQILGDLVNLDDLPLPLAKKEPAKRIFSSEPIAADALKAVDADVFFRAKRLVAHGLNLNEVESQVLLNGGRLIVKPAKAMLAGGQVQGAMVFDGSDAAGASLDINLNTTGVQAGLLARDLAASDMLEGGPLDLRIDLKGKGLSQQALAAALTGEVRAVMGPGRVRNSALDTFGADVGMSAIRAINPFAKDEPHTQIKCGVARFVFANGKAVADRSIALESEKMVVTGSGQVELASEQIDFAIKPEAREGLGINLGSAASMIRLTGTLSQPTVGLDAMETAKKALSVGTALATGGISLLVDGLIGRATQDAAPCRTALGPSQVGGQPQAGAPQSSPPSPAAAVPNPTPVPAPQPKEEGGLGGLLRGLGKGIDDALGVKKP